MEVDKHIHVCLEILASSRGGLDLHDGAWGEYYTTAAKLVCFILERKRHKIKCKNSCAIICVQ